MASRTVAVPTTVVAADVAIKSASGRVWWITISNSHATDSAAVTADGPGIGTTVIPASTAAAMIASCVS